MARNSKSQNPAKRAEALAELEEMEQRLIPKKKVTPKWLVPTFVTLLVVGLLWVVVFYITNTYPIPGIHSWNILIGFVIMLVGFIMTMWWQ
ncbi:MAG: cell division protein CrgA [Bifidobacteriaceae bacterium]|nr:cell division protein CrgA [Bifidobacteriaceae bacterium]